jgi:hypothetical protein
MARSPTRVRLLLGDPSTAQPPVNPASHPLRTSTCNFMPLLFLPLIGLGAWAPFWLRKSSCNVVVHTKNNWCFSCFHVLNLVINNSFFSKTFLRFVFCISHSISKINVSITMLRLFLKM